MPRSASALPDVGLIQQHGGKASIGFAGMSSTGAAVQACLQRIVFGLAAVTAEDDQPRKSFGQSHASQHRLGQIRLAGGGQTLAGSGLAASGQVDRDLVA